MMSEDDVPLQLTELDRWGGRVMARLEDGWCAALDRATMLCGIYARRPIICREYEVGGSDCIAERLNLDKIEPGQAKFAARLTQALPPSPLSARKRASGK